MAKQSFQAGSVLLSERPLVRSDVKSLAHGMAQQRERFELLRGQENLAAKEALMSLKHDAISILD